MKGWVFCFVDFCALNKNKQRILAVAEGLKEQFSRMSNSEERKRKEEKKKKVKRSGDTRELIE